MEGGEGREAGRQGSGKEGKGGQGRGGESLPRLEITSGYALAADPIINYLFCIKQIAKSPCTTTDQRTAINKVLIWRKADAWRDINGTDRDRRLVHKSLE